MEFVTITPVTPFEALFSLEGVRRRTPVRKRILRLLSITPATIADMEAALEVDRAKLAGHMRALVEGGHVLEDRSGPVARYIRA